MRRAGKSVLILEKTHLVGGTTARARVVPCGFRIILSWNATASRILR